MKKQLQERDIKNIWHPYTEISSFETSDFPIIDRSEGVYIYTTEGEKLLDGIASWWCVNLGHSHPRLVKAIQDQAARLQHVILGGMSHVPAIELSEKLINITPEKLKHVFYAGDGSSSIEVSLKVALQYWVNQGVKGKNRFICLNDGYHGDTLGAIGVGYVDTFHRDFKDVIMPSFRACSPHCLDCPFGKKAGQCEIECFDSMEELIREHHECTAAVIVEPLCQGAAGIRIYPEEYLQKLRKLCDQYNLILIADEIAVGFGRTGEMFACQKAGIQPDIMTVGKGLTGGYLPLSASLVTDEIYDCFRAKPGKDRTLYHGHTFCANPITTALASAAIDVYADENILESIKPKIIQLEEGMKVLQDCFSNSESLSKGMIGIIEIDSSEGGSLRARSITQHAMANGLFIRPLGNSIYLWPPLTASQNELAEMLDIFKEAIIQTRP